MRRARKVVDNGTGPFAIPLAQLTEAIISNDKLDALTESIRSIEMPEYPEIEIPEYPTDITVSNLPEVQKVEVLNFPEQKAPIVNVPAPVVNIPAPIVNVEAQETQEIDITPIAKEVAKIRAMLESEEKDDTDFEKLFKDLGDKISSIKSGAGGGLSATILGNTNVNVQPAPYATQIDDTSTASVTYLGRASVGSSTASAVWQIQKIDESTSPATIKWADGNASFDNIFNNRTSLTYN